MKNYANFSGRARRSEFWYFVLWQFIFEGALVLAASVIMALSSESNPGVTLINLVLSLFALATLLPTFAVGVRRLHDTGKSGWWMLLGLIPLGGLVVFVFQAMDGEPGANQWGPNPKSIEA